MPAQARSVVVHKFGGAALADAGAIAGVVRLLALDRTGTRRVVAASALMGVTDALVQTATTAAASGDLDGALAAARELCARHQGVATDLMLDSPAIAERIDASFEELETLLDRVAGSREMTPRTRDEILARGERLSAAILAAALERAGIASTVADAQEFLLHRRSRRQRRARSRAHRRVGARRAGAAARARAARRRAGLHRRRPRRRGRHPRPRGHRSHRHGARARARGERGHAVEGRRGVHDRRSSSRARCARRSAARRARGVRARVLRREGAPSAHARAAAARARSCASGRSPIPNRPAPRSCRDAPRADRPCARCRRSSSRRSSPCRGTA